MHVDHKRQFMEMIHEEAEKIDPETAIVDWGFGEILDPYGLTDVPEECNCVGRLYFARAPESDVWVSFYDLPEETLHALRVRLERKI